MLLNKLNAPFDDGDITILHRERLKLFYPSREAALAEGYTDFGDDDICPLTQRVYRLAGFRFDSRELLMRVWGIMGASRNGACACSAWPATAATLERFDACWKKPRSWTAFGYRPNAVPVFNSHAGHEPEPERGHAHGD